MGYYDQDSENRSQRKRGSRAGYFLAALAGVIIGAILVMVAFPNLGIGDENQTTITEDATGGNNGSNDIQNLSVDVNTAVTKAVDKASDAVVGITNTQSSDFWGQGEGQGEGEGEGGTAGSGSGVVYKKTDGKAWIITNNHVIEGANELEVTLNDGTKLPAEVRGSDPWTDLAVIEVDSEKVKTIAEFGKSSALKLGEPVIAIGNPLGLQFSGSITKGIISGLERTIEIDINQDGEVDWNAEVLQTDAAINPGNSGGALVNLSGQVIGINSMKIAQEAVEGIGLSIPIDSVIPIISDIEKYGEVRRPYMGVNLASVKEISQYHQQNTLKLPKNVTTGVAITGVQPNSPASKAGIKEFDVIVEMDGEKVDDVVKLRKFLYNEKQIGENIEITYYRNGKKETTTFELSRETM
ncbi:PDZ domain-containing protein [Peribacillus cavernae]|uniref:PDZ domain-containing protein n=1 Tax=Peribacillus cavernae TaxID=1674310 RepID=A0A3S0U929_9BACI|nr:trypsin-like peptidase domain-containing protein [Peribacillus cavernae]MDQ0220970.1 serine protease Do [Peribacillus cavernae]RUQ24505.1 PDZ domain-containing protein [Peribacillus cavernae]